MSDQEAPFHLAMLETEVEPELVIVPPTTTSLPRTATLVTGRFVPPFMSTQELPSQNVT